MSHDIKTLPSAELLDFYLHLILKPLNYMEDEHEKIVDGVSILRTEILMRMSK